MLLAVAGALGCGGGGDASCPQVTDPLPHPPGWATVLSSDPARFHGTAARQRADCVCCHGQLDASLVCVACHAAGGPSLHPPGWATTHATAEIPANAPAAIGGGISVGCLACHQP